MAWKETHVMDERMKFVADWLSGEVSLAELCRWYGVSRKTGYKFIGGFGGGGGWRGGRGWRAVGGGPNQVWGMDFKGWFRTGDGQRCAPFTVSDLASRYVLRLQALDRPDGAHVWPILEATFREVGLPEVIRSDNGPPFASTAAGGLSWLAVRLIKAGVKPERIKPG